MSIADLIKQKQKALYIAELKSREERPNDDEWSLCKKYIDGMDREYKTVLDYATKNIPSEIVIRETSKITTIRVPLPAFKEFEASLVIKESKEGVALSVYYIAYNEINAIAYAKEVLNKM